MSAPDVDATSPDSTSTPGDGQRAHPPRVRQAARDGLSVAGVSLGCSVAFTLACWALLRWLG